jgi:UDP-GlcNAc:undecaprenyl-phosphate GlcNAc-1-phosphate transferase
LDGLCAGIGLLSTLALFTLGWTHASVELQIATLPLAGALLGFLCYNFSRATMFLGDSGALLIGFLVGCFVLLWSISLQGTAFDGSLVDRLIRAAPVLTLFLPILEVLLSIVRRFLAGRAIFSADRAHIHHRLLDRGLTPQKAVLTLYLWSGIGAVFGVVLALRPPGPWPWFVLGIFCLTICLGIQQLRYPELQMAAHLLMRGEFRKAIRGRHVR